MFGLHVIMMIITLIIISPIGKVVRCIRSLTEALQLSNSPCIKQRMYDYLFQKNEKRASDHRRALSTVFPYSAAGLLLLTGIVWTLFSLDIVVDQTFLFLYCLYASGYSFWALTFDEKPQWLLSWTTNMEMIQQTIALEEINKEIDSIQKSITELEQTSDDPRVLAAVEQLEQKLNQLIAQGGEHITSLRSNEPNIDTVDTVKRDNE